MKMIATAAMVQDVIKQWADHEVKPKADRVDLIDADDAEASEVTAPAQTLLDPRRINQFIDPERQES